MSQFRITVARDDLAFAAGHFITYGGHSETLHGHNYRVRVGLEGDLDGNSHVWDFGSLRRLIRPLLDELDRRTLLPMNNPALRVVEDGDGVEVFYRDGRYVFPRRDVVLLPIHNTSAEMLARYLAGRVKEELEKQGTDRLSLLTVTARCD
jgi:6-pyruvoyltetrahydropterin/6-carboxytetrahydropterin synthase